MKSLVAIFILLIQFLSLNSQQMIPDSGFGGDGIIDLDGESHYLDYHPKDAALKADGKILMSGYYSGNNDAGIVVVQVNEDGSPDLEFGGGRFAYLFGGGGDNFGGNHMISAGQR